MHIVAWMGNRDVAELLLERGADPNKGDNYGETPLDIAQRHGHEDIVNMMRALGKEEETNDAEDEDSEDEGPPAPKRIKLE